MFSTKKNSWKAKICVIQLKFNFPEKVLLHTFRLHHRENTKWNYKFKSFVYLKDSFKVRTKWNKSSMKFKLKQNFINRNKHTTLSIFGSNKTFKSLCCYHSLQLSIFVTTTAANFQIFILNRKPEVSDQQ